MDGMNAVSWFEIPARDLTRAKAFYDHLLGIEMSVHAMGPLQMAWFPWVEGAPGAAGALVQNENYVPSHAGSMVYFSVPSIDPVVARASSKGGKVLNPKMSIGEYGFVAHLEDSEGNRIALHSRTG